MSITGPRVSSSALSGGKRKIGTGSGAARKKAKTQHLDALPWKTISRPMETGLGGDNGILELEEVDDIEVVYQETEAGRVVKFNVLREATPTGEDEAIEVDEEESEIEYIPVPEAAPFDSETLLPNWHPLSLHAQLLHTLHAKGFLTPTPIQAKAIPIAMTGRDVVGVAQTGSGKTLAYGIPILNYILSQPRPTTKTKRRLRALILAPTRELALQVSSHLNALLSTLIEGIKEEPVEESLEKEDGVAETPAPSAPRKGRARVKGKQPADPEVLRDAGGRKIKAPAVVPEPAPATQARPSGPPIVSVAAIVGGMSAQKQKRVIERGVDVLVATPGRLWDIMQDDDDLAQQVKTLKFLILDEADRMIEAGHFAELENILRLTLRQSSDDEIEPTEEETQIEEDPTTAMQTFVFSATLSKDLQRNVKKKSRPNAAAKFRKTQQPATTLDDLVLRLDFRDPEPEVIDLSPEGGVVSTLKESKIECLTTDKDVYLYYFFLRYPGRSLVFLSSIDGIRRLMPLMEMLNVKAFPLHSQLEQRQRLKNLDRFKTTQNSVLLATDIAARGLDIPAVDHVIHYQIPRTADAYVHRNGRTARAMQKGFSMLMCAPDERKMVRALLGTLGRQDTEIPEITIELNLLDKLKARVHLARKIEQAQHKVKKMNHERNWMKEAAEAMEIELGSDFNSDDDTEEKPSRQIAKAKKAKVSRLKAKLKRLLGQPLVARGISTRYITSGSVSIVDDLISGDYNGTMLGMKNAEAGSELVVKKKVAPKKEEYEEWDGVVDTT